MAAIALSVDGRILLWRVTSAAVAPELGEPRVGILSHWEQGCDIYICNSELQL